MRAGDFSERALAKRADLSQPHLHNALKGIRILSPEATDRLMHALDVTVPQVLWSSSVGNAAEIRAVPILRNRIGPGTVASFSIFSGYMPFPAGMLARLKEPLSAYLAPDLALPKEYRAGDLVLLDPAPALRIAIPQFSSCVVAENAGLRVRYVRRSDGALDVASDPDFSEPADRQSIPLHGRNILDIVRARIVWIGREVETPLAGSSGPTRGGD